MMIEQNTNYAYKLKYMDNPTFDKVRDLATKFYRELPKELQDDWGSNLSQKIGNPPKLKTHHCFCMWSDLLGFGEMFQLNNWSLSHSQKRRIYDRLKAAHSAVLYYSSFEERNEHCFFKSFLIGKRWD